MKRIALDAMGSDRAPDAEVAGAIAATRSAKLKVLLVGDRERLVQALASAHADTTGIEVVHASQVITMADLPSDAMRKKKDASMRVAAELVKKGEADAVVSAGNSGAMMGCGIFVLRRQSGIDRPAILTSLPTINAGQFGEVAILDMGANVDCRPLHLVQFAVMGACYARVVGGKSMPRVGVLTNGEESHKGTRLTRETHRLLSTFPASFSYVGYVEGRDIFSSKVDVVVCDGFTGNLVLKVTEGVVEALHQMTKVHLTANWWRKLLTLGLVPAFRQLKGRIDHAEFGGAPLLGITKPAVVCHGASSARAIENAVLAAARFADCHVAEAIDEAVVSHEALFAAAKICGDTNAQDSTDVGPS